MVGCNLMKRLIKACTQQIRWIWKATAETQRYARPRLHSYTAGVLQPPLINTRRECFLRVFVRDNNVDQALRVLKKKMQREGVFREMKRRRFYEKPSEKAAREEAEGIRRARKAARKKAQWEGLVAAPNKKKVLPGRAARPRFGSESGPVRLP
jgi:small subunit ribosomal protein S21